MKNQSTPHINKTVALISIVIGCASWFVCRYIYTEYHNTLSGPLLIGILFALLFAVVFLSVLIGSVLTGSFDRGSILYEGAGGMFIYFICSVASMFVLAMFLEYLYELNPAIKELKPTSYIFVIDESGSMGDNDPNGLRYEAIPKIMEAEKNDFPYMVYTFSDDSKIIREMSPAAESYEEIPITYGGETSIYGTILRILQDYKDNVWDGGDTPKVIFLTDGYATDLSNRFLWFKGNIPEFNAALDEYSDLGINISTVGMGSVDKELMRKIAETTGGVFINVHNADDLAEAMKTAATSYSDRDLISIRYMKHRNTMYGLLRVLFLSILGTVLGSLMILAYVDDPSIPIIVFSSVVLSILGSILLEVGLKSGILQSVLWLIMWLMFSLTIGYYSKTPSGTSGSSFLEKTNDCYLHSR